MQMETREVGRRAEDAPQRPPSHLHARPSLHPSLLAPDAGARLGMRVPGTSHYNRLPHSHAGVKAGQALLYLVVPAVNSSARPPTPERQNAPPRLHGTAASAMLRFQPHLYGVCDPVAQPEVHWSGLLRDRHRAPTLRRHCGGWDSISINFDFDDERPSGRFHDVQHPSQPQLEASNGSSRSFLSSWETC